MEKPNHTRPFDIKQAKAGARFSTRRGDSVRVLAWDVGVDYPIVGCAAGNPDSLRRWAPKGSFLSGEQSPSDLVMLPVKMIDGKPAFTGDTVEYRYLGSSWGSGPLPSIPGAELEYRWPLGAPKTNLSGIELEQVWNATPGNFHAGRRAIANTAIEHALRDGSVVLPLTSTQADGPEPPATAEPLPEPLVELTTPDRLRELAARVRRLPLRSVGDSDAAFALANDIERLAYSRQ